MSAVELLAAGLKAPTGTGDAVDVSAHAQLRLVVDTRGTDMGRSPEAKVWIETSRDGVAGWKVAQEIPFLHHHSASDRYPFEARPVNIGDVDAFARVRWWSRANANTADGDPALMLGVAGEGIPDAP